MPLGSVRLEAQAELIWGDRIEAMGTTVALPDPSQIPRGLREVLPRLSSAGEPALLFGPCLRELLLGTRPLSFAVVTALPIQTLLARFPQAISLRPEQGIVQLPTRAGPIALHSLAAGYSALERLADQDFTIHAIGWDGGMEGARDPLGGMQDLASGVLRTAGNARASFEKFPLRVLRSARLCAQIPLHPASDLLSAMNAAAPRLTGVHRMQLRGEIEALLLGPRVRVALDLLRRGGVEERLAPGVSADSPRVVERLPPRLAIRLAGWLRGTRAPRILRGIGQPSARISHVEALLQRHPVDARKSDASRVARLPRQQRQDLFSLRAAEIEAGADASGASAKLKSLQERIDAWEQEAQVAQQRATLALDGNAVMRHLAIGPGPRVGAALRHLGQRVAADPSCNEPAELRRLLDSWHETEGACRNR